MIQTRRCVKSGLIPNLFKVRNPFRRALMAGSPSQLPNKMRCKPTEMASRIGWPTEKRSGIGLLQQQKGQE